jgi:hypothetical protein
MVNTNHKLFIFWHTFLGDSESRFRYIIQRQIKELIPILPIAGGVFVTIGDFWILSFIRGLVPVEFLNLFSFSSVVEPYHEGVTTSLIFDMVFKGEILSEDLILYFHSRGSSRTWSCNTTVPSDQWTMCMEYYLLTNYDKVVEKLHNYYTVGLEMFSHSNRIDSSSDVSVWHYSGNFWWARASWISNLRDPKSISTGNFEIDRYLLSEDWILSPENGTLRLDDHCVIHRTGPIYKRGMFNTYKDPYIGKYYRPYDSYSKSLPSPLHLNGRILWDCLELYSHLNFFRLFLVFIAILSRVTYDKSKPYIKRLLLPILVFSTLGF